MRPTGHGSAASQGHPKACAELQVTGAGKEMQAAAIGFQNREKSLVGDQMVGRYQIDRAADASATKLRLLFNFSY